MTKRNEYERQSKLVSKKKLHRPLKNEVDTI